MILLATVALFLVFTYVLYDRTLGAITRPDVREQPQSAGPPPPLLQRPFNVLLIGVDAREGAPDEGIRSDTLIVVHVDPINRWASMLSIPRDTFVSIPYRTDVAGTKITLAYSWGYQNPEIYGAGTNPVDAGQALAADTVEEFLGITIDYTVQVDHMGFQGVVDAIDGITIDVPHTILDAEYPTEDFGYIRLLIKPGLQRMNGETALQYARTRHVDSDFGRSERQQQVLQAALCELKGRGTFGRLEALPQLVNAVTQNVKTTLPLDDLSTLRGLATLGQQISIDQIQRFTINPDTVALDQRYDNVYDLYWDQESLQAYVQEFLRGPTPPASTPEATTGAPETATIQVQNGKGIRGLAGQVSLDLELVGFQVAQASDAPTPDNPHSLILDYSGKPETRTRLARVFNISPEYVRDETANGAAAPFGVDIVVLLGEDYTPEQLNTAAASEPLPTAVVAAAPAPAAEAVPQDTGPCR
jgi:polyisoprenyl-teichoic acid--peptidoglycan teichoic acid transferase